MAAVRVLVLALTVAFAAGDSCTLPDPAKKDCGYVGIDQQQCEAKGCCWQPVANALRRPVDASDTPWCFYKSSGPTPPPPPPPPGPGQAPFSQAEVAGMLSNFLGQIDIQGSGAVVASPDHNTPGGSYYYHWARDGALTMHTLTILADGDASKYQKQFQDYTNWVNRMHTMNDPNQVDVRVEAKFNIPDGTPYSGGWCRPQTDGPGLRAIALIGFAEGLIKAGQESFVKQYLWTGNNNSYAGGAIYHDLAWVVDNWQSQGCDLWEEVRDTDFFWNRFTMRRALRVGAAFAATMKDASSAAKYNQTANAVESTLNAHWKGSFIAEAGQRQKDAAVICAFNDGYNDDGLIGPTSTQVAGTIKAYNDLFHSTFPVNQADDQKGIPGILYGRYEGDHYAGGNPWVLTSACLAELYYRGASEAAAMRKPVEPEVASAWSDTLGLTTDVLSTGARLARALADAGDGVLKRIRYHTAPLFQMPEQLDKNTGYEASAANLTWSYATVLKAMHRRGQYQEQVARNL